MRKILHNINFYIQIKNVIDFLSKMYYHIMCSFRYAPVAQLDRASDYGSEGCGFDFCRARQVENPETKSLGVFSLRWR